MKRHLRLTTDSEHRTMFWSEVPTPRSAHRALSRWEQRLNLDPYSMPPLVQIEQGGGGGSMKILENKKGRKGRKDRKFMQMRPSPVFGLK